MDRQTLTDGFIKGFGIKNPDLQYFFSPGRVNLIGEHIDYNGGLVFPTALTMGVYGAVRRRDDLRIRLISEGIENKVEFTIGDNIEYGKADGWGNYPKGIIKYLTDEGYSLKGCDIYIASTLPEASGLSSSAALEVLVAYIMLYPIVAENVDRVWLSRLCQKVENQFIGVCCGIMDQLAVACGREGNAILLDCDTLEYKYVPFKLDSCRLIIMNTNKKRGLADSKYNERRSECEQALDIIKAHKNITALCQASIKDVEKYITDPTVRLRAEHAVEENQRVLSAVNALEAGDIKGFGRLLNESHASLRDKYQVTGFELDAMQKEASRTTGCFGARMTGAGFGGCAIAIVENSSIESFIYQVKAGYEKTVGIVPSFYVSCTGDGVKRIMV